jgi:hypothetical protein
MPNGDEKTCTSVREALTKNGVLDSEQEIQHATKFIDKAGLVVFNSGKMHVEGADSALKKWPGARRPVLGRERCWGQAASPRDRDAWRSALARPVAAARWGTHPPGKGVVSRSFSGGPSTKLRRRAFFLKIS